jgi:hypothetical protein
MSANLVGIATLNMLFSTSDHGDARVGRRVNRTNCERKVTVSAGTLLKLKVIDFVSQLTQVIKITVIGANMSSPKARAQASGAGSQKAKYHPQCSCQSHMRGPRRHRHRFSSA